MVRARTPTSFDEPFDDGPELPESYYLDFIKMMVRRHAPTLQYDSDEEGPELPESEYPETDPNAMPGSPEHLDILKDTVDTLNHYYEKRTNVYVAGDMMVYYRRNNRRAFVYPDVFVALGAEKRFRRSYRTWADGPLTWTLEVTSPSTRDVDLDNKFKIYAAMSVTEYFLFDPPEGEVPIGVQGYTLINGLYQPIALNARGRIPAVALGLELAVVDDKLRLFETATNTMLLKPAEAAQQAAEQALAAQLRAEQALAAERARNDALAAELAELRRRLGQ